MVVSWMETVRRRTRGGAAGIGFRLVGAGVCTSLSFLEPKTLPGISPGLPTFLRSQGVGAGALPAALLCPLLDTACSCTRRRRFVHAHPCSPAPQPRWPCGLPALPDAAAGLGFRGSPLPALTPRRAAVALRKRVGRGHLQSRSPASAGPHCGCRAWWDSAGPSRSCCRHPGPAHGPRPPSGLGVAPRSPTRSPSRPPGTAPRLRVAGRLSEAVVAAPPQGRGLQSH